MTLGYQEFLRSKLQLGGEHGFAPEWEPAALFDFQRHLVEWALRRGRAAIFADCGLGKTAMQLTWAENVARHAKGRVLILTPLAVGPQTVHEGEKFGVECSRDERARIVVANYERLHHFTPSDFAGVVCDESSILKSFDGKTRNALQEFMRTIPMRLLCTATAAPNDYTELGTSSEALGEMGHVDMLNRFFANDQNTSDLRKKWRAQSGRSNGDGHWRFSVVIVKPRIGAWGLNLQHCAHVVTFASHSYEQHYQAVRRCWRFGQTRPVTVDVVATEGEAGVAANLRRKSEAADRMFAALLEHINGALRMERWDRYVKSVEVPAWLAQSN